MVVYIICCLYSLIDDNTKKILKRTLLGKRWTQAINEDRADERPHIKYLLRNVVSIFFKRFPAKNLLLQC